METISIKLDEAFRKDMEKVMKENRYSTKTEFIREAVRDKMNELETKMALKRVEKMYGAGRKPGRVITDGDLRRAREEAANEIMKKFDLD